MLAAVIQTVPVIVRSMPPEAVKSLPHVFVGNWQGPDKVAIWTLRIAIATLFAVGVQLFLAMREVAYVKRDLKNNETQLAELMKRPELQMTLYCQLLNPKFPVAPRELANVQLLMSVLNVGTRTARQIMVQLEIPEATLEVDRLFSSDYRTETQDRVTYACFELAAPYDRVLWAGAFSLDLTKELTLRANVDRLTVFYAIHDEYGRYPSEGYGRFDFTSNDLHDIRRGSVAGGDTTVGRHNYVKSIGSEELAFSNISPAGKS
jgi:hypothetical protein